MAVYLSPGVYAREIDLSTLPTAQGPLRPAFIGTAKKGPLNHPTFISTAQQFIDTFGEPFTTSNLGYAVLAYLERGNQCYVVRVGIAYSAGLDASIIDDAIDTSGAKHQGWGRIPVFTGVDFGRIFLRSDSVAYDIHAASTDSSATFIDQEVSSEVTTASLAITGTYTGTVSGVITLTITGDATTGNFEGAAYAIVDAAGTRTIGTFGAPGTATVAGLTLTVASDAPLGVGDLFTFAAVADNRKFKVQTRASSATSWTETAELTVVAGDYATASDLVDALNTALTGTAVSAVVATNAAGVDVPAFQTNVAGVMLQISSGISFCQEVGVPLYTADLPCSHVMAANSGPYTITSDSNSVAFQVIGRVETVNLTAVLPDSTQILTAAELAGLLEAFNTVSGTAYYHAFSIIVPDATSSGLTTNLVVAVHTEADQIKLKATYTNIDTLRFSNEVGVAYPYTSETRSFWDSDRWTPAATASNYTAYITNIVGWFVAATPGTWANSHAVTIENSSTSLNADNAGVFKISITDGNGVVVEVIDNVSFDPAADRYIGNVINPGARYSTKDGNAFINWELASQALTADPVRVPSPLTVEFSGGADGIPSDSLMSSQLDMAVIGNPALDTGIWSLQNPDVFDINLIATPGFTSGAIIGQCLQFCENRGDVLYIVDAPQGLRPQEAVDWHNGMHHSDLSAAINSSYGALYWSWIKISDYFNGGNVWVPPSGHVAAIFAVTANVAEVWTPPAGLNRGIIQTALDVEYNPTLGERDLLYGSGNAVNAIVNMVGQGIVVWGQRTLQRRESATNRVNVRMLMTEIKKNVVRTLRSFVFEINDQFLRRQVLNTLNPYLADIAARRGLTAFKVVCDESNNTSERIDRNELWVSIWLKPARAAEFIVLNMTILKTGASFTAQEVLAAGGVVVQG